MPPATWHATGGNGGGYVSATVTASSDRLYGFQPVDVSGFGNLTGGRLTVDYKIDGSVTGASTPMVRFYVGSLASGNNYFVSKDAYSWDPNAGSAWKTHAINLVSANFIEWPNAAAHNQTFDQVIAGPQDIGLVFTNDAAHFGDNSYLGVAGNCLATVGIDNFGVLAVGDHPAPEPASLTLLAAGATAMLWRRRICRSV
jgi:hypothetical protein